MGFFIYTDMKYLKSYSIYESVSMNQLIDYIKDVLLELDDDLYLTKVWVVSKGESVSISIKKKMDTGYSVVNVSDVLPTIEHILNYINDNNFKYSIKVQPLWWSDNQLKSIDKIEDDYKGQYGEIRITITN